MKCFFSTISFFSNKNKDKFRKLKVDDHSKWYSPHLSFSSKLETINSSPWHFCIFKCFIRTFIFITYAYSGDIRSPNSTILLTRAYESSLSAANLVIFFKTFAYKQVFLFYSQICRDAPRQSNSFGTRFGER